MNSLQDATLDLLWSLWSELGVPGRRRHQSVAVDPEPLIAWTPCLAAGDPRLLGLAFDWCLANAEHVAKTRLPGLAKTMPDVPRRAFAAFNGALGRHGIEWRPRARPSGLDKSRGTMALPMERLGLVRFRIRALCGASVRAEVLAALLAAEGRGAQTALLSPAGFTRRSVERALGDLAAAKLVTVQGGPRRRIFRLRDHQAFERTVLGGTLRWTDWHQAFSFAGALGELAARGPQSPRLRRVEATSGFQRLADLAVSLSFESPPGPMEREDLSEALLAWGAQQVGRL